MFWGSDFTVYGSELKVVGVARRCRTCESWMTSKRAGGPSGVSVGTCTHAKGQDAAPDT
jgi:hypothetical protein